MSKCLVQVMRFSIQNQSYGEILASNFGQSMRGIIALGSGSVQHVRKRNPVCKLQGKKVLQYLYDKFHVGYWTIVSC